MLSWIPRRGFGILGATLLSLVAASCVTGGDTADEPASSSESIPISPALVRFASPIDVEQLPLRSSCDEDSATGGGWDPGTQLLVTEVGTGTCLGWNLVVAGATSSWALDAELTEDRPSEMASATQEGASSSPASETPVVTATASPSPTPPPTATATPTATQLATPVARAQGTPSPTPRATTSPTPAASATSTPTPTPIAPACAIEDAISAAIRQFGAGSDTPGQRYRVLPRRWRVDHRSPRCRSDLDSDTPVPSRQPDR